MNRVATAAGPRVPVLAGSLLRLGPAGTSFAPALLTQTTLRAYGDKSPSDKARKDKQKKDKDSKDKHDKDEKQKVKDEAAAGDKGQKKK
jgi:hypothetical protein